MNTEDVPVFILAGGLGTRLKEHTEFRPKPMVEVGDKPILWHILRKYRSHGFRKFVICAGFKAEAIKRYMLDFDALNSDFTVKLGSHQVEYRNRSADEDWEVTVAFTGELTMTGGRIARAARQYLGSAEHFAVTYGDGLCDVDLTAEWNFHSEHGAIGTVLGVNPPSRFGQLLLDGDVVSSFSEKPDLHDMWINGGFFFFKRQFVDYINTDEACVLEKDPLIRLAQDGQLHMFQHTGFWACMDTQRDKEQLDEIWRSGNAPWVPAS
ncbi:MAG: glucose-1-phosphate cytidylyltransferase [Sphingomonas sp.]